MGRVRWAIAHAVAVIGPQAVAMIAHRRKLLRFGSDVAQADFLGRFPRGGGPSARRRSASARLPAASSFLISLFSTRSFIALFQ